MSELFGQKFGLEGLFLQIAAVLRAAGRGRCGAAGAGGLQAVEPISASLRWDPQLHAHQIGRAHV